MLTISAKSWHFRLYQHWRHKIARNPPALINLCHYMRATLIYVPGYYIGIGLLYLGIGLLVVALSPLWVPVWAVHKLLKKRQPEWRRTRAVGRWLAYWLEPAAPWILGTVGVGALVFAFVMLSLEEWWKGLAIFGAFLGLSVIAAAGLFAIITLADSIDQRRERKAMESLPERPSGPKSPSIFSLMWKWIKAKKKKICPLIQPDRIEQ